MNPEREDGGGGREDGVSPTPPPPHSRRVRLEVELLDADQAAPAAAPSAALDERTCLTVIVVAAEPDFRRYVRECLRERADLYVLEAATVTAAVALAADHSPDLLVVDEPEREVFATLPQLRAIVIVDDEPHGPPTSGTHPRLLARPFTAEGLVAEVGQLLLDALSSRPAVIPSEARDRWRPDRELRFLPSSLALLWAGAALGLTRPLYRELCGQIGRAHV